MDLRQSLRRVGTGWLAALLAVVTLPLVILYPSGRAEAFPAPVFTMYVPLEEVDISTALFSILTTPPYNTPGDITSQITLTSAADNALIYWDHWEDGYETDIANPVQPTTQVWGDGNIANGAAPGVTTDAGDVVNGGTVIQLENSIDITPRDPSVIRFDGRDKVAGTRGFVMTRAAWDTTLGTVHAGAVATSDLSKYGTQFSVPIGENIESNQAFEYTSLSVIASDVNTVVEVDIDGDGVFDPAFGAVLGAGETHFIDGGVNAGAFVQTSKPSQVHLITGDVGSLVASRWFEVFPEEVLSDEYVAAVSTTDAAQPVSTFVHNPGSSQITVAVDALGTANDTSLSIVAGGTVSYTLPIGSGARFSSPGNNFSVVSATVSLFGDGRTYDWGYTLVPVSQLTSGVVVGWGAGDSTGTRDDSPVWIAPLANTDLNIDFDGDGTTDQTIVGVQQYQSVKVVDPDHDMTGARISSPTGVLLSAAWGQDPDTAHATTAYDLGTAVLPSTALVVTKSATLVIDTNGDGSVNPGDTLRYSITAVDAGTLPLDDVVIIDNLPSTLEYVPGTTTVDGVPVPDDVGGGTVFPVDDDGVNTPGLTVAQLLPGSSAVVTFEAALADPFPIFVQTIRNSVAVTSDTDSAVATSIVPVVVPDLNISKSSNATGPVVAGQTFDYVIDVANIDVTPQTGINVTDTLPSEVTWVSTSVTRPIDDPNPGGFVSVTEAFNDPPAYNNNAAQWLTNWIETDSAGTAQSPTAGNVRVVSDLGSNRLRMEGPNQRIRRSFDGTNWEKAIVSFQHRREGFDADDKVSFQVSTTGGLSWIELDAFLGPGTDTAYPSTPATYDLTRFLGQPVQLRFVTSANFTAGADRFYFDNFQLELTNRISQTVAGSPPPNVYTGGDLLLDESFTVRITVTVDPGIDPSIDSITNTARAVSLQSPSPVIDSHSTPIARAQVGDTVWHDLDGDGVVDAGEPRLAGVTVTLFDAGGSPVDTRVTDAAGQYSFGGSATDLDPGDYTVAVTSGLPAGMVPVFDADAAGPTDADGSADVSLGFGEVNTTTNFGYVYPVTLGDTVFADLGGDGIQNGADFGIDGIPVTITGPSHATGSTVTTDSSGYYEFIGLLPGAYTITVDTASLSNAAYSTTGGDSQNRVLVSNVDDDTVDFGYVIPAAIGDFVWHDLNADGVQDPGEPPFVGVTVEITGPGISGTESRTTDANGFYLFADLDAGTFQVTAVPGTGDLPAAFGSSTGGASRSVTVGVDEVVDTVDFGFYTLTSIGDEVFDDLNGDGDRDPGEPGLDGIDVTITGTTPGASHPGGFTVQTVGGAYDFVGLEPGTYTVTVDDSGFHPATLNTLNGASPTVSVVSGDDVNDADFGFTFPVMFGDTVFHDLNANNVRDAGEPGLNGVELTLVDDGTGLPVATVTTSGDGHYLFSGLPTGSYTVTLDTGTLPAGYVITDGDDADSATLPTSGSSYLGADFAVHTTSDIGDTVFHDLNNDGDQDPGEPGLVGIDVTITGTDWNGQPIVVAVPTQTTGPGGSYLFADLMPGTYVVTVDTGTVPVGYTVTAGDDTRTTLLQSGTDRLALDFGYATAGSIGDYVWNDIDGDGIQNDGPASTVGFAGVTVNLTGVRSDASVIPPQSTTTDANGAYLFNALEPGTYTVSVDTADLPVGVVSSTGGSNVTTTIDSDETDLSIDFGYTVGASIGDFVYIDSNADGSPAGEAGLDLVTVTLSQGGTDIATVDTANGAYAFDGLLPGTYTVTITSTDLPGGGVGQIGTTSRTVTITSGNVSDTFDVDTDFGFYTLADIGDFVFDDLNGNGIHNVGEPGIDGVTVTLAQGGSDLASVDTVGGTYLFADLTPGSYTVRIDLSDLDPDATVTLPAVGSSRSTTLTSGNDVLTLDFGVANPVTIGDFVYEDLNGNGSQDVGEPGIDGIDVTITGTSAGASHPGGTTVTTVSGAYEFDLLRPGSYTVTVAGTQTGGYTATTATLRTGTLASGDTDDTFDFGFARPATLGDFVYEDLDGDGIQDPGEPGLAGVELTLSGPGVPTGPAAPTITTGPSGAYSFSGLDADPSAYTVTVTSVPGGYTNTAGGTSQSTVLSSNETDGSLDFGYFLGAAIGDTIYDDLDGDGVQDVGEPGLGSVVVQLDDGNAITPVLTTTTDASGNYQFGGLQPGTYTVSVQSGLPSGSVNTEGGTSQTFTVVSGDVETDADFGYYRPGRIGDFLWEDTDGDGTQDEPASNGISGVTVTLTGTDASGGAIPWQSTTTGINGAYEFTGLEPGDYTVTVDSADADLTGRTTSTTGGFVTNVTIVSGDDDDTVDFGVAAPATIGDFVFADNDGTGTFGAGDAPLDGVTVTLSGTAGDGAAITPVVVVTDAAGFYEFTGVLPGDYAVTVSATGDLDGDEISTTGGLVQSVVIVSGGDVDTVDFGFAEPALIGDTLFLDVNGNGVQDGGEPGIPDVTVVVTGPSYPAGSGSTFVTGPTGTYAASNLLPGDYTVAVDTADPQFDAAWRSTTGGDSQVHSLGAGGAILTADFGYAVPVSIGDVVFLDDNGDGVQGGDAGLGGVQLQLTGGDLVAPLTTTSVSVAGPGGPVGSYSFDDLMPGTYTVTVIGGLPANSLFTTTGGAVQVSTTTSGNDDVDRDFGVAVRGSIGDFVYEDSDGDGTQLDASAGTESGYAGATVTITGPSHPSGLDVVTGPGGAYSVPNLAPGQYTVSVAVAPGDTVVEGAAGYTIDLTSGQTSGVADFGVVRPGSVGDVVYEDLNGNGVQDLGEPGVNGIEVTLGGDGAATTTTATLGGVDGSYVFSGLAPGDYTIDVTGGLPAGAVLVEGGSGQTRTVESGDVVVDADFGFFVPVTIGDYVWDDLNGNGLADDGLPADRGIAGVELTLDDGNAVTVDPTATTDANGSYSFTNVAPGSYTVTITGGLAAGDTVTSSGGTIPGTNTVTVVAVSGTDIDTVDFGVAHPAALGDLVFIDDNANGSFDGTDAGLASVPITITGVSAGASHPGGTTISTDPSGASQGAYGLGSLLPGTYVVVIDIADLPATAVPTTARVVRDDIGGTDTIVATLTSGQSDLAVDFGYALPAGIGDQLFVDNNANGVFDTADDPIAGVDITLTGPGHPTGTTIATDANGIYNFTDLAVGVYTVTVDVDDPQFDAVFPGGSEISSTGPTTRTVVLTSDEFATTIDFGFYALGSIGDFVFDDANGDGNHTGDTGIDAVTVTLDDGNPFTPVVTVDTVDGDYSFPDLVPGTYTVTVVVPGTIATTPGGTTQTITILSGQDRADADFGVATPAGLGDTIFHDLDGDGTQDIGEPGLDGITVTLSGGTLPSDLTTTTDSNGVYSFTGLEPGDYTVTVTNSDLPTGTYTVTTPITGTVGSDDTIDVTLTSGTDDNTIDFGYAAPATIGDFVFDDLDGDGAFDVGEPGINGVTIELSGGGLAAPITTTTSTLAGVAGSYRFVGVDPSGNDYTVTVVDPTGGVLTDAINTFGGTAQTFAVISATDDLTHDFGFRFPAAIGDLVFTDVDGNGTYNPLVDTPLDGVTVTLDDGNPLTPPLTVITGSGAFGPGEYGFDDLAPGTYTATVTAGAPAGAVIAPITVSLVSGQTDLDVDFPVVENVTIGDFVWHDRNDDGVQDTLESGIAGVTVQLRNVVTSATFTDTTDGNGAYLFTDVAPGEWVVEILPANRPADFAPAFGNTESRPYTVTSGADIADADFNYKKTASVGDFVWDDLDGDGIQDLGEPGIGGVSIQLDGVGVTLNTSTDPSGAYSFAGLQPGDYTLTFVAPPGTTATTAGGTTRTVSLLSEQDDDSIDVGFASGASIGDLVFHDLDVDGIADLGEPGLGGIEVLLDGPGGSRSTTTDGNGAYQFNGLVPGTYTITINPATVPVGTVSGAGLTTTTHLGGPVEFVRTVTSGGVVTDADFGYATTAVIGDTVFEDDNGNGVQDGVEGGLGGVGVELLTGSPGSYVVVDVTSTQPDGSYQFTGVAPGTYSVRIDPATLPAGFDAGSATSADVVDVTVESDDSDLDADFGFARPAIVGDRVWHDLDADGVQDADEPGLAGVWIELVDATDPDPLTNVVDTQITDGLGAYRFEDVDPGIYVVRVAMATVPSGVNSGVQMVPSDGVPTANAIMVGSGDTILNQDFAFHTVARIGDSVWHDLDADGAENDGAPTDPWLDSVTVELVDAITSTVVQTQTTIDGAYDFGGVAPGTYEVRVGNVPAGYSSTTGNNPLTLTVLSDEVVDTADFGFALLTGGSIGNESFDDLDGDGVRDGGEPGFVVDVELFLDTSGGGAPVWTSQGTRRTTGGGYLFANLAPGDYEVRVDPASIPAGYGPTTPGGLVRSTTLISGATDLTLDFGFATTATIGDYVWHDLDADGAQDDGAPSAVGLAGVRVEVRDLGGVLVGSDTTDANGAYSIDVAPGIYDVTMVPATFPVGAQSGTAFTATTPSTVRVTVVSNEVRGDLDFGLATTATIGDTIFDDLDGDGSQDPGEPGLPGVTVVLDDGNPLTPPVTAITGPGGVYTFPGLAPGGYTVAVDPGTLPAGYQPTTSTTPVGVVVESDDQRDDVDLGFVRPGSISGVVFTDDDADGDQTGESGVGAVTIDLLDAGGVVVGTTSTAGDGSYTFGGLLPGDYTVRPVLPVGALLTTPNETGDDATDSDVLPATGRSHVITMTSGADITDVDAGIYELATLGDTVYVDLDGDGVQDPGEPGLPGVDIVVRDADGAVIGTATTGADGVYSITVVPGTHTVSIIAPSGYRVDPGRDELIVTLGSGATDLDVDFPVVGTGSLSGALIYDVANDGVIHPSDPGLGGVPVTATWIGPDGPVVRTTTTDPDGSYRFDDLPPGDWTVAIDPANLPNGIVDPTIDPDATIDLTSVIGVAGGAVTDVDFGVSGTASLGDNVFVDLNENGVLDPGEPGIPGVRVTTVVNTVAGPMTYVTITDGDGRYQFDNLPAGDYTVTIDLTTLPAGMESLEPSKSTTLVINGVDLTLDMPVVMRVGPVANPDARTTPNDTPVIVTVLDNDTIVPGTSVTIVSVTTPDDGTAVVNGDGTITYTPDAGFVGTDGFDYTICDLDALARAGDTPAMRAVFCSTTTVTITTPPPPPPTAGGQSNPPTNPPTNPVTPPTTPSGTSTSATGSGTPTSNPIPRTGSDLGPIQTSALLLLITGLFLLAASRRRRHDPLT